MKKILPALIFLFSFHLNSQTVTSTCAGSATLMAKYAKDAARLALRHSYHTNSTYTDSARIDPVLKHRYLDALLAVYNCSLSVRDTVIDTLKIHTNPSLELNGVAVNANSTNAWMQQLQNSVIPTGYQPIDQLISKYHLYEQTYYQATQYDVVILKTDTNSNMAAIAAKFAAESTVISSSPTVAYDDTRNITDSLNSAFTILNYSYGWGSCNDGCDFRSYWAFKVYTSDCSVEYLGHSGNNLVAVGTGIRENSAAFNDAQVFPNPATDQLTIQFTSSQNKVELEIVTPLGQTILHETLQHAGSYKADLTGLNSGLYFVKLKNETGSRIVKVVKQ